MNARWESIDFRSELARLQNEFQQAFGLSGLRWPVEPGNAAAAGTASPGQGTAGKSTAGQAAGRPLASSATTAPAVNVWADENSIYVESELPGLDAGDVELLVTGRQLTLRGERKPPVVEKGVWHRQERPYGKFQRTLELPVDVDAAAVEASFQNGVLRVKLPKHAEIRPRRVEIKFS